mmetsp:Transcript_44604/g.133340  ORF Transcript_44604/g.133340 Transcript_44604/m.133340 type:complete len:94 (-) Transcript_44604:305-586(-)
MHGPDCFPIRAVDSPAAAAMCSASGIMRRLHAAARKRHGVEPLSTIRPIANTTFTDVPGLLASSSVMSQAPTICCIVLLPVAGDSARAYSILC